MLQKLRLFWVIALVFLLSGIVFGEAFPPKVGTVKVYSSRNAKYTVSIRLLGYPDASPSECTFAASGKQVWTKLIPTTPSKVVISENGERIVMTNWGWYDEGGSQSLSIYNRMGELSKEIPFGQMKWVRVLAISPDGSCCIVGVNTVQNAFFSLYDCQTGELKWEKGYGFSETSEAKVANGGDYILVATNDYHSGDMQFLLLDSKGVVLYHKLLAKNYSYDVPDYLRFKDNGKEFEFFDKNTNQYLVEPLLQNKGGN